MSEWTLHPMAEEMIVHYGGFTQYESLDDQYVERWRGRVPASLLSLWAVEGLGSIANGSLQFCRPEAFDEVLDTLLGSDAELLPRECHVAAYSAFGCLYVWSETWASFTVDLRTMALSCSKFDKPGYRADPDRSVFSMMNTGGLKGRVFDEYDEKENQLYKRAVKKLGPLKPGEVYGFFPALAMGGANRLENLRRVSAVEHFEFLAELGPLRAMNFSNWPATFIRNIGE